MFIYWLKNRAAFSLFASIIVVLVSCLVFVNPNIEYSAQNRAETSVYELSKIDYDIPSPTRDQLLNINDYEFIDETFGYFYTQSQVMIGTKNIRTNILLSDNLLNLDFTMYNSNRLIEFTEIDNVNPIYIDFEYSKKNNLTLDDKIKFLNNEFTVSRIYETNSYFSSCVFIPMLEQSIFYGIEKETPYSGAFLKVNNHEKAEHFLRNYKPLGRLKDKSSFESEEAYQDHYNAWNNTDFYNEITSFESRLESINIKSHISNYIAYVLLIVVISTLNLLLICRKSEVKYFNTLKDKKQIKKYYIFNELFSTLTMIVIVIIMFILALNIPLYIPSSIISCGYIGISASILISLFINVIVDIVFYKRKMLR